MDFLYHAAVGLIIAKAGTGQYLPEAALLAVVPNIVGFSSQAIGIFQKSLQSKHKWKTFLKESQRTTFYSDFDKNSYRISHALLTWILVTLLLKSLVPSLWGVLSLCYLSHILIDILTHGGDFAQRPFFPISDWHVQATFWAKSKKVALGFWFVLLTVAMTQILLFL